MDVQTVDRQIEQSEDTQQVQLARFPDPSRAIFYCVAYDYRTERTEDDESIMVFSGDLVVIMTMTNAEGYPAEWWYYCGTRDGQLVYLPWNYLAYMPRREEGPGQHDDAVHRNYAIGLSQRLQCCH